MYLRGGFTASAANEIGAVRLIGARIGGGLDCAGAKRTNAAGPALAAASPQVDVYLSDGFTASAAGELGAVRLLRSHIGRLLDFRGAVELKIPPGRSWISARLPPTGCGCPPPHHLRQRGPRPTAFIWGLQALVWALATLAITGYTGLIRKIT